MEATRSEMTFSCKEPVKDFDSSMILMNGFLPVLKFKLIIYKGRTGRLTDVFPKFDVTEILNLSKSFLFHRKELHDFLKRRFPYKRREYIGLIMRLANVKNLYELINYTGLASLNDTFWVKPSGSELKWEQVSLYRNKFDESIANAAFGGYKSLQPESYTPVYTTPELSTNGTFPKCWFRDSRGDIFLKKAGNLTDTEPYSEYYAQQILDALDIPHVEYSLHKDDRLYTVCKLFTSEEVGFVPIGQVCQGCFEDIFLYMKERGMEESFCDMLIADTVMMNEDRHLGNFGFTVNNPDGKITGFAPLFDHNLSLLWGDPKPALNSLKFRGHKISDNPENTFIDIISPDMISAKMRKKLEAMKGFKLKKHPEYNLPDEKLNVLNSLINYQITGLLSLK